jgi:hypothetical protein
VAPLSLRLFKTARQQQQKNNAFPLYIHNTVFKWQVSPSLA